MSQQIPIDNDRAYLTNTSFVRRLFVHTGYGWIELANSLGRLIESNYVRDDRRIARIVEEYTPPSPTGKTVEIKLASSQSIVHGTGKSSYKTQLRLIFPDSITYTDFVFFMSSEFKFYDERGSIFKCAITEQPTIKRVEAGARYDVSITLTGIRKDTDEFESPVEFADLAANTVHYIKISDYGYGKSYPQFTFDAVGISTTVTVDNSGYLSSTWNLGDIVAGATYRVSIPQSIAKQFSDAGLDTYFGIDYGVDEVILTPKQSDFVGSVTIDRRGYSADFTVETSGGNHWASKDITEIAQAGIVATQDGRGNQIYTFRPGAKTTRAEAATMINNTRKWIERMIRG